MRLKVANKGHFVVKKVGPQMLFCDKRWTPFSHFTFFQGQKKQLLNMNRPPFQGPYSNGIRDAGEQFALKVRKIMPVSFYFFFILIDQEYLEDIIDISISTPSSSPYPPLNCEWQDHTSVSMSRLETVSWIRDHGSTPYINV